MGSKKINHNDNVGKTINYLTILSVRKVFASGCVRYRYVCRCKCGKEHDVDALSVCHGRQISCGCIKKEKMKYNVSTAAIPSYRSWHGMMQRCYNTTNPGYKNYGGRGIIVCERWHTFDNFLADMGYGEFGMSIERRENDKNYEPANCRWATRKEQNNNTRRTRKYLIHGVVMTRDDISLVFGIKRHSIQHYELKRGKNIYQILNI